MKFCSKLGRQPSVFKSVGECQPSFSFSKKRSLNAQSTSVTDVRIFELLPNGHSKSCPYLLVLLESYRNLGKSQKMFNRIPATISHTPNSFCKRCNTTPSTIRIEGGFFASIFANTCSIESASFSGIFWFILLEERSYEAWGLMPYFKNRIEGIVSSLLYCSPITLYYYCYCIKLSVPNFDNCSVVMSNFEVFCYD